MVNILSRLGGTLRTLFRVGRGFLDSSLLTTDRTLRFRDTTVEYFNGSTYVDLAATGASTRVLNRPEVAIPTRNQGVIYPLYWFIANAYTDVRLATLINQIRSHPDVPIMIVLNTSANGPGTTVDPNADVASKFLMGAGAKIIGYVDTNYGATPFATVQADILAWKTLYPQLCGIFFDRVGYGSASGAVAEAARRADYKAHRVYAESLGAEAQVFNSGPLLDDWYPVKDNVFGNGITVLAEGTAFPSLGDQIGSNNTHLFLPSPQRALILHTQTVASLIPAAGAAQYYGWIHLAEDGVYQTHPSFFGLLLDTLRVAGGVPSANYTAVFGDGTTTGSIAAGSVAFVQATKLGTVLSWKLLSDTPVNAVVRVWKLNAAVPTGANSITPSNPPTLTGSSIATSSTLAGWVNTVVASGDIFGFQFESYSGSAKSVTLTLEVG